MKYNREDVQTLNSAQFLKKFKRMPVDKNDPAAAGTAIYITVPLNFSKKAKAAMDYFDDTAWIFEYKGKLVITDEALSLTEHGNGTFGSPFGGPRGDFDTWDEFEAWLELVYEDLVSDGLLQPMGSEG